MFRIYFLLILLSFLFPAKACVCGSHYNNLSTAAGPVITIPAHTLEKNRFGFGFGLNFINYGEFSAAKFKYLNHRNIHAHSIDTAMLLNSSFTYGITDNLNLSLIIPFYFGYGLTSTNLGSTINDGDSIGFGDISLLAKYRFLNSITHHCSIAVLAGIKMPTGDINQKNEFGYLLSTDDQPGTGSWDPLMGLAISKSFGRLNLDSNLLYLLSTKGKYDTTVGDQIFFNFSLNRLLEKLSTRNLKISAVTEINGQWLEKIEFNGLKDPNHGGLVIYLTPGLKFNYKDKVFTNLYISFPTIQDLNGEQSDINLQLGFNVNFLI